MKKILKKKEGASMKQKLSMRSKSIEKMRNAEYNRLREMEKRKEFEENLKHKLGSIEEKGNLTLINILFNY